MRVGLALLSDIGLDSVISEHFGQCENFMLAEIEDNKIKEFKIVKNNVVHGGGGCQTVDEILQHNINIMIAGGMGGNAQYKFANAGVKLYSFAGTAKAALDKLIKSELGGLTPCKEHGGVC